MGGLAVHLAIGLLMLGAVGFPVVPGSNPHRLPSLDIRYQPEEAPASLQSRIGRKKTGLGGAILMDVADGKQQLKASVPGLKTSFDPLLGGPRTVRSGRGFLTAPNRKDTPEQIVRDFVSNNHRFFGLSRTRFDDHLKTTAAYKNPESDTNWVYLQQQVGGIPVFQGELRAAVTGKGQVAALVNQLCPGLDESLVPLTPGLTGEDAVLAAGKHLGYGVQLHELVRKAEVEGSDWTQFESSGEVSTMAARQVVFPLGPGEAVLAWEVVMVTASECFLLVVDASDGTVLVLKDNMREQTQTATFKVFNSRSPAPGCPYPFPLSSVQTTMTLGPQAPNVPQVVYTLISELPDYDDLGWIKDGWNYTKGNNCWAGIDFFSPDGIDIDPMEPGKYMMAYGNSSGPSPNNRNFQYTITPPLAGTDGPTSGVIPNEPFNSAEVTNMFFWINRYHDQMYRYGFTEQGRNFQESNFGRGGVADDYIEAEAQDYSGVINANFSITPDGIKGRCQMYVWDGMDWYYTMAEPWRSSAIDQDVLLHELTHGLTSRIVGNASGIGFSQGYGLAEGWSDLFALSLQVKSTDDPNGIYAAAGWIAYKMFGEGFDNYFYGDRRFPYSADRRINPMTFKDIDPDQFFVDDGNYPVNPIMTGYGPFYASEAHMMGEIWCNMCWTARTYVAQRFMRPGDPFGYAAKDHWLQIITDSLKFTPTNPSWVEARDAILDAALLAPDQQTTDTSDADPVNTSSAALDELAIWRAFASRGLGWTAQAPPGTDGSSYYGYAAPWTVAPVEAYDVPLSVGVPMISDPGPGGNNNGFVEPGETVNLYLPLSNEFVRATLSGTSGTMTAITGGVTVVQPLSLYGNVAPDTSVQGGAYRLYVDPDIVPCGGDFYLRFDFTSDQKCTATATVRVETGKTTRAFQNFDWTGSIPVTGSTPIYASVKVDSAITSVGLTTVSLKQIRYPRVGDLTIRLTSPGVADQTIDNPTTGDVSRVTGNWENASFGGSYGLSCLTKKKGNGSARVTYYPTIITAGFYQVYEWHPASSLNTASAPVVITHAGGVSTNLVNQRVNGGKWNAVGTFPFSGSSAENVAVSDALPIGDEDRNVVADAFLFVYAGTLGNKTITLVDRLANGDGFNFTADILNITLDDNGIASIQSQGDLVHGGVFKPAEPLSSFHGHPAVGNWTLTVMTDDPSSPPQGTLDAWSLAIAPQRDPCPAPTLLHNTFITSAEGWEGYTAGEASKQNIVYNPNGAGSLKLETQPSSQIRVPAWTSPGIPYLNVPNQVYRMNAWVFRSGQPDPDDQSQIPNMRIRCQARFAQDNMVEWFFDPTQFDVPMGPIMLANAPSTDPMNPTLYTVDFDPVDVPALVGEEIRGTIENYSIYPNEQGSLEVAEAVVVRYSAPEEEDGKLVRVYGGADFLTGVPGRFSYGGTLPSITTGTLGITLDSTPVPDGALSGVSWDFRAADGNDPVIEPSRAYRIRYHVTGNTPSDNNPQMRLRARTLKWCYTNKLEVGSAKAAGSINNTIAAQALPGEGCMNLNRLGTDTQGGYYDQYFNSPPVLPADENLRKLRFGFDLIDGLNPHSNEKGRFRLDSIEVREFDQRQ